MQEFIDARAREEYEVSHIQGSIWVGYDHFTLEHIKGIQKDAHIAVYCSIGYRSGKIAAELKQAGYPLVYNVYGGIFEWINRAYPLTDLHGKKTNRIHGFSPAWSIWLARGERVYSK